VTLNGKTFCAASHLFVQLALSVQSPHLGGRLEPNAERIISLLRATRCPEDRLFGLGQRHAADGSLADAAEIQRAFMLDDIGDLGEALRGRVLHVAHDLAV